MATKGSDNKIGDLSIEDFTKNGLAMVIEATKAVNAFPSGTSRLLYGAYPTFGKVVDRHSERLINMTSSILRNQKMRGNIERRQRDEQFELLLECNDVMLERISSNLDELAGLRKRPETVLIETQISSTSNLLKSYGSWNVNANAGLNANSKAAAATLLTAKNIARPQVNFKVPVDNSANNPFEPRIKFKPNSLKPLAVLPEYDDDGFVVSYLHPYEFELDKFQPPPAQLKKSEPILPESIEKTEYAYVDTEELLQKTLEELKQEKEIAVDLEHHSYRTFQGITCLLQITTRRKDYVIDTLKLREELHILNDVFTDPKVVKIFHGADLDVEWLQRDLSIYVVNMFDSHEAAKTLGYPRLSLAYLLKHFCGIDADKTLRIADWRIRPLPDELIAYARQDTHFLIYIYEMMRNELIEKQNGDTRLLKAVYEMSRDICKKRYQKPRILPDSHMDIYRKSKVVFDNRQLIALKDIFAWRDKMARQEDESYGYVLPNHMMLKIAETLPREMQGILACCNPIPPLVRQNLHILHQIILNARRQPLVKPIIEERIVNRVVKVSNKDFNSKLHCPHDLSHDPEFRNDLPTLLGNKLNNKCTENIETSTPVLSMFEKSDSEASQIRKKLKILKTLKFVSPYERYKAVVPIVEREKLNAIMMEDDNKKPILEPEKEKPKEVSEKPEKPEQPILEDAGPSKRKIEFAPSDEESERKRRKTDSFKHKKQRRRMKVKDSMRDIEESEPQIEVEDAEDKNWDEESGGEIGATKSNENENSQSTSIENEEAVEENADDSSSEVEEVNGKNESENDSSATKNEKPGTSTRKKLSKNMKNKKGKPKPRMKTGQKSDQPIEFDYSKVDFKKFQGGIKAKTPETYQSKFHRKGGNKADNKKFNKLFTFSKVNKGHKK